MSWIYNGTLPSIEDPARRSAPPDIPDMEEEELSPLEEGREARMCCHGRDKNPYHEKRHPEERAGWFEGWDEEDNEPEEEAL